MSLNMYEIIEFTQNNRESVEVRNKIKKKFKSNLGLSILTPPLSFLLISGTCRVSLSF